MVPVLCSGEHKNRTVAALSCNLTVTFSTMSNNVDWDSKVVIGSKAKAPKVTRNTTDLNGTYHHGIKHL